MKVTYNKTQLQAAANFICKHNLLISYTEAEIYAKIKRTIKEQAKLMVTSKRKSGVRIWASFGAQISLYKENGYIDAEISVDPAVGIYPQKYKSYKI